MIKTINNAIAKSRAERDDNEKGFTLIELLVVVLIIGILAAIAIPAFLSQREGAWVTSVETALKNAATSGENYAVGNGGSYKLFDPMSADDKLNGGFNPTDDVKVKVESASATEFKLSATHTNLGADKTYTYSNADGVVKAPAGS